MVAVDENSPSDPATVTAGVERTELIQIGSRTHPSSRASQAKINPFMDMKASSNVRTANDICSDHHFICWSASSIYAALGEHGLMQGTTCLDSQQDARCPPEYLALPEALRPTPLQLAMPHRRWIDRFPFPRLRDNMILLSALIDLDDFVRDLFGTESLTLRKDCATWEPQSWVIGPEFSAKWGYLFR